ncbi:MAG TPA: LysR family transcriptional regulator [Stellaceae bacterium]|nr:LysR family transcriptional regulator [Stellaceae bacterium]
MNINAIDLNLLIAFDAIMRERHVTVAAHRIGITQPAMSNALARLRKLFNDPLFVRTSHGMEPTPYAEQLADPIGRACDLIADALRTGSTFEPAKSSRTFTFYMTDIGEVVLLPAILRHVRSVAPQVALKVVRIPPLGAQEAMASGEVDLAIGLFPSLQAGFYEQRLYRDHFVCVARADHPRIRNVLTARQFSEVPHVFVSSAGTGHEAAVENIIAAQRVKRTIALTVPHFLVLPTIVSQSDLIVTVPERVARSFQSSTNLKLLKPPIKFPEIEIKQHWHERLHHDPANKWMRSVIAQLFKS